MAKFLVKASYTADGREGRSERRWDKQAGRRGQDGRGARREP